MRILRAIRDKFSEMVDDVIGLETPPRDEIRTFSTREQNMAALYKLAYKTLENPMKPNLSQREPIRFYDRHKMGPQITYHLNSQEWWHFKGKITTENVLDFIKGLDWIVIVEILDGYQIGTKPVSEEQNDVTCGFG